MGLEIRLAALFGTGTSLVFNRLRYHTVFPKQQQQQQQNPHFAIASISVQQECSSYSGVSEQNRTMLQCPMIVVL